MFSTFNDTQDLNPLSLSNPPVNKAKTPLPLVYKDGKSQQPLESASWHYHSSIINCTSSRERRLQTGRSALMTSAPAKILMMLTSQAQNPIARKLNSVFNYLFQYFLARHFS